MAKLDRNPCICDQVNQDPSAKEGSHGSPEVSAASSPAEALYRNDTSIRWYIIAVSAYALVAIGFVIYVSQCPTEAVGIKVLASWNLTVNQFYSGVALSAFLTPAAILIRRLASDLALLHPFAIASSQPTAVKDLDCFMNPGLSSTLRLFKYSIITGLIQAILSLSGAVLVPVGTLVATTGFYAAPTENVGVVGMPTLSLNTARLSMEVAEPWTQYGHLINMSSIYQVPGFIETAVDSFVGNLIQQTGVLPEAIYQLGPESTAYLNYEEGVRYEGIVTFEWSSGCKYTDEIRYTKPTGDEAWFYNVSFPGRNQVWFGDAFGSEICVVGKVDSDAVYTLFYATVGNVPHTVNMDEVRATNAVEESEGAWISRVACTPTFRWQISNCTWKNSSMTQCQESPGANTTAIDTLGLDELLYLMSAVPLTVNELSHYTFGQPTLETALMFDLNGTYIDQYRAPQLSDFEKMYGAVARTIVSLATSGYYGSAEVPTRGSSLKQVYLVREYILGIVVAMLVLVPALAQGFLLWNLHRHTPLRRATFLTISNAVRGSYWDKTLCGGCVMPHSQLTKRHEGLRVMFGVDANLPGHVGLAPNILPIQKSAFYAGSRRVEGRQLVI